jgi:hypothetical protein
MELRPDRGQMRKFSHIAESVLGNIWPMVPSCTHKSFNLAQPIGWSKQAMSLASRTRSGIAAT